MKAYAILVVHNKKLIDCPSFCSAVKEPDMQLLVVDNSTDESIDNQEEALQAGAWFLSMNGNKGLSKAYNAALDRLRKEIGDWIILLDDDTRIPAEYWEAVRTEIPDSVLLPIVRTCRGEIISPAEMKHGIPHQVESLDSINVITGINSGMVIPKQLTDSYRYYERLFLDFVDHKFLQDIHNRHVPVRLLPVYIEQTFSADSPSVDSAIKRLKIQKKDLKVFYEKSPWKAHFLLLKRTIRLFLQLKTLKVLFYG